MANENKIKLVAEMLGCVPVDVALATRRAEVCVKCLENQPGDWSTMFTTGASVLIRKIISERAGLEMETIHDEKLNICQACICPLKLKVFMSADLIREHTDKETMDRFTPECWIRKELQ